MNNDEQIRYYGFHRAKVVSAEDELQVGRVLVWIPDIMTFLPDTEGLWARPANNPIGGRNSEEGTDNNYMGSQYIPRKGSWVWIFFEAGNPNRPYYFAGLDLENAKALPETRIGKVKTDKWVIFKSNDGRTIVVSDDDDDERVEITGKKRKLKDPPSGDTASVYPIDDNQTSILFDERDGKEKVLIRTHKGDFLHIDIDEQKLQAYFKEGIEIKTDQNLNLTAKEDVNIQAEFGNVNIQAKSSTINLKAGIDINEQSGNEHNLKAATNSNKQAGKTVSVKGGTLIAHDAPTLTDQGGASSPAGDAGDATAADPKGERNT